MLIGVPLETVDAETRVAVTPETAKKLKGQGHELRLQSNAGRMASAPDTAYEAAGAQITDVRGAWACDLLLKVRPPQPAEAALLKPGSTVVGMLNPFDAEGLQRLACCRRHLVSRSKRRRASRARRAWTCCRAKPTSPATRR